MMGFLETVTVAEAVIVIGSILLILETIRRAWPFLRKAVAVVDALDDLPAAVATVRSFESKFDALAERVETIHYEVTPNSGGSMKDQARRTDLAVAQIAAAQAESAKTIEALCVHLGKNIEG